MSEIKVITIPQEVFTSCIRQLINRVESLEGIIQQHMLGDGEGKIRIGEVVKLLQNKGIKCGSNQTAERWLKRNGISPVSGQSSNRYYLQHTILNKLKQLGY